MSGIAGMGNDIASDVAIGGDPRIAVIAVGGAGCRIASALYERACRADIIAINTDREALQQTSADRRIYICKAVTQGLGTRGDAALGKKCAQIHEDEIMAAVRGYDYALIVAGMGGGTGTGAAPVIAELCDRVGVDASAMAIMPFSFESDRAFKAAEGYRRLHSICKTVIKVNNENALSMGYRTMDEALRAVDAAVVNLIFGFIEDAPIISSEHLARKAAAGSSSAKRSGDSVPETVGSLSGKTLS
ncbi:MAG: cell division protein FtsZ [Candidatus Methanomethylophilus sp.]|nr:cell division protein FtsZ [Methanomethylophilus sp.]